MRKIVRTKKCLHTILYPPAGHVGIASEPDEDGGIWVANRCYGPEHLEVLAIETSDGVYLASNGRVIDTINRKVFEFADGEGRATGYDDLWKVVVQ